MSSAVVEAVSTEVPVLARSPLDLPIAQFRSDLDRRASNRAALIQWVREGMVDGIDFGRIHAVGKNRCNLAAQGRAAECQNPAHWSKASLFKPGAEKICGMLGLTVHFPTLSDYETAAISGVDLTQIIMRCEIRDSAGSVVADGVGARNIKQDFGDINKSLKMAEKSAHIDATLRLAGLSEVFTQDIEETQAATAGGQSVAGQLDPKDLAALEKRIAALGIDRDRLSLWLVKATRGRVQRLESLTPALKEKLSERLDEWERNAKQSNSRAEATKKEKA